MAKNSELLAIPEFENLPEDQISWWVGVMQKQGLLSGPVDTSKMIFE